MNLGWAIPSPDGTKLAIWKATGTSNVWLAESEGTASENARPNLVTLKITSPHRLTVYKRVVETGRRLSGWMVGKPYLESLRLLPACP
jgi:hypothetical protein